MRVTSTSTPVGARALPRRVVLPVPEQPGVKPKQKLITLVTCNPRWGSSTRLIVYGHLTKAYPKPGPLPAELAYTAKKA